VCVCVCVNIPRCHLDLHSKVALFTDPYFLTYFSVKIIVTIYYVTSQFA
jgi:hypothetical protein